MGKKTIVFIFLLNFISFFFFVNTNGVVAADATGKGDSGTPSTISLCDPISGVCGGQGTSPQILIGKVINAVLGIVGSLALVMFIYGGFTWMTAAGNEQSVTKGKDILIWATVGLIVIFSAYALVKFVFTGIGAA